MARCLDLPVRHWLLINCELQTAVAMLLFIKFRISREDLFIWLLHSDVYLSRTVTSVCTFRRLRNSNNNEIKPVLTIHIYSSTLLLILYVTTALYERCSHYSDLSCPIKR